MSLEKKPLFRKVFLLFLVIGFSTSIIFIITPFYIPYKSWDLETGVAVNDIDISADDKYFVIGLGDFYNEEGEEFDGIYFFERGNKEPLWTYETEGRASSVDISNDGTYIVAGTDWASGELFFFLRSNNDPIWTFKDTEDIYDVAISSDGQKIACGASNKVYCFGKYSPTPLWNYITDEGIHCIDITSDGKYIVAGGWDGKVYMFNSSNNTPIWVYDTNSMYIDCLKISENDKYVVLGTECEKKHSERNNVYLFNITDSNPLVSYQTDNPVEAVDISDDGQYFIAGVNSYGSETELLCFKQSSSKPIWNIESTGYIASVSISKDGNFIATEGLQTNTISYYKRGEDEPIWTHNSERAFVIEFSEDSDYFLAGGQTRFYFYDVDNPSLFSDYLVLLSVGIIALVILGIYFPIVYSIKAKGKKEALDSSNNELTE